MHPSFGLALNNHPLQRVTVTSAEPRQCDLGVLGGMRRAFARSSREYKKDGNQSFFRELRNRCSAPELPPYLVSRWSARITCHCLGSTGERPVGWQSKHPWHERLSGVAFCDFRKLEKICAFWLKGLYTFEHLYADTASLGEDSFLFAVP